MIDHLLNLVSDGNIQRASFHSTLAMDLAHSAGLNHESNRPLPNLVREERRRCFWSIILLKRLHGADFTILDFSVEENFPWYPKSTGNPSKNISGTPLNSEVNGNRNMVEDKADLGIVAFAIQLSEVVSTSFQIMLAGKTRES
jgi:hypothetical protein